MLLAFDNIKDYDREKHKSLTHLLNKCSATHIPTNMTASTTNTIIILWSIWALAASSAPPTTKRN